MKQIVTVFVPGVDQTTLAVEEHFKVEEKIVLN